MRRAQPGAEPFTLTRRGEDRVRGLPEPLAVTIRTVHNERGYVVTANEGPPAEGEEVGEFLPGTVISQEDVRRLAGLKLDHDGDRWMVTARVDVRAFETPNPNSRRYAINRPLSDRSLYFTRTTTPPPPVDRLFERADVSAVLINGPSLVVERVPNSGWDPIDQAVTAAIREHFLLAGAPLSDAHVPDRDDPFEQEVLEVLRTRVLPGIHRDGGDLHLVSIHDGVVHVHLVGACRTCPSAGLTLRGGVEQILKDAFPGRIRRVEQA